MDKKGELGNQVMLFSFFFLLVVIGVGIVAGVWLFYGQGYDFRQAEAEVLNYEIKKCLVNEKIDKSSFADEFYEKCRLNKEVVEQGIVKIIRDNEIVFSIGDEVQCGLSEKNENYPKCVEREIGVYKVLTGSNQRVRRLS